MSTAPLHNMAIIVTGAGTGIGRATARACARRGAHVLAVGRRPDRLKETAQNHPTIRPMPADITAPDGPQRIAQEARTAFGRINALVNNAAILGGGPLPQTTHDDALALLETNLIAPMLLARAVLEDLRNHSGTIANISTTVGQRGWPGNALYAAAKSALDTLTRSWAVELADQGVRVVAVAPGAVETPIAENNGLPAKQRAAIRDWQITMTPMGRIGTPEEVAWALTALLSPQASFITGAVLPVDGGALVG